MVNFCLLCECEGDGVPLYEYECTKCRKHIERIEKFSGPNIRKCPTCGGKLERLVSAPAIQFKGSGWYVTDYARKGAGSESKASGDGESNKQAGKSESKGEEKSSSDAKESKDSKESRESKDSRESKEKKKTDTKKK
jgi:putative FmdB family regulatory protein